MFPQAKPSILTFGLLAPQDGEPTSTLPAAIFPKELPKGEKESVFFPNCGSLITGLLVRAGGEPQKKATWLLESVSTSGSFLLRMRSTTSQVGSALYNGSAPLDLGLGLLRSCGRQGRGQMMSIRGAGCTSICQNLDLRSGIGSALEIWWAAPAPSLIMWSMPMPSTEMIVEQQLVAARRRRRRPGRLV